MIKRFLPSSATAAAMLWFLAANFAVAQTPSQSFPNKPVRFIIPLPPGTPPDIRSRQIAQKLTDEWRQPVVVENRPGASGSIAMELAARAAPDGHTIVMATTISLAIMPHLTKLPFDPLKDFVPVSKVTSGPFILVAHPGVPFNSVKELVAYARANPTKLNAASGGSGSGGHLAIILFSKAAAIQLTHIPYKGGTQTTADLISGQVQLMFDIAVVVDPHIKAGRIKALAVASGKRLAVLPQIPTFEELGYAGLNITVWQGILVPAGTPPEIVDALNGAIVKVLNLPDVRESIINAGGEIGGDSPEVFASFIRAEHERWGKLIAEAGIRLD